MQMHLPKEYPKGTELWMCDCGEAVSHGRIVTSRGLGTELFTTKRRARIYVNAMLADGYVNDAEAVMIRQQIDGSSLKELPNDFHVCDTCWIPVPHGHFTINDEEIDTKYSIRGAIIALGRLKETSNLTEDDFFRIDGQIFSSRLPNISDVDLVQMAYDELQCRQQADLANTLSTVTRMIEIGMERQSQFASLPVFPPTSKLTN